MDENANTENADRSPFRRFPHVQLAFCIACLTMTAWTWMRYSYAWEMTLNELRLGRPGLGQPRQVLVDFYHANVQRYVRFSGFYAGDSYSNFKFLEDGSEHYMGFYYPPLHKIALGTPVTVTGRLLMGYMSEPVVRGDASRFHPASVAGIVVGGMGCFIFGLYLRRWLRERRAT